MVCTVRLGAGRLGYASTLVRASIYKSHLVTIEDSLLGRVTQDKYRSSTNGMKSLVILISAVAMVAAAPMETKNTVMNVDGPEGRQVQTGEPGKAVSGYFTSRNTDGVEYGKGFRARGLRLPVSSARLPATFPVRYPSPVFPAYGYRYDPLNYLPFFQPTYSQDKYLADGESFSYNNWAYKHDDEFPFSEAEEFALAQNDQVPLTEQEIADLTERGLLTPMLMPFMLMNKKNMLILMLINKMLMAMG